ncbi:MAG: hypothetical protein Q8R70_06285 [Methanoregula sp.]|nr:hypothetical protein [Methanoregula sp.]
MKTFHVLLAVGIMLLLFTCGCTSTPPQAAAPATAVSTPVITTAAPTAVPYPDALDLGQKAAFGTEDKTGELAVYRAEVKQNYTWNSPSWNSPREQAASGPLLDTQRGYNTATPQPGNTFLFVFIKAASTGKNAAYAPSPQQCVVNIHEQTYAYQTVPGADVTISGISQNQYDFLLGKGASGGYIQPGASNAVDGYLIYEVPAPVDPKNTYLLCNLDQKIQKFWRLG